MLTQSGPHYRVLHASILHHGANEVSGFEKAKAPIELYALLNDKEFEAALS